jgi:hypothetical protein
VSDEPWVGLAEAIGALRQELTTAMDAAGPDARVRFELQPVELEFLLEVRKEGAGEAGVRFGVVTISGKGGVSSASTHRLKLSLKPQDPGGEQLRIRDRERDLTVKPQDPSGAASRIRDQERG